MQIKIMDIQWFERLFENMEIQSYMFRYIVLQSMGLISYASDVYRCVAAYLYNYIWMFHFYYSYEIIWLIVAFDYFTYNLIGNVYQYTGYIVPHVCLRFLSARRRRFGVAAWNPSCKDFLTDPARWKFRKSTDSFQNRYICNKE